MQQASRHIYFVLYFTIINHVILLSETVLLFKIKFFLTCSVASNCVGLDRIVLLFLARSGIACQLSHS